MDVTQIIGLLAAVLITFASVPQAYIIIRDKSTSTISANTYTLLFLGSVLWFIYGIIKADLPIIIANSISTLMNLIILILKVTSQKVINKVHKAVLPETIKEKAKKNNTNKKK